MQSFSEFLLLLLVAAVKNSLGYDLSFNTDKDLNFWKFNGSYIYSRSIQDVAALIPASVLEIQEPFRPGLWLIRYAGPQADNYLTLQYALHHHLLMQGLIQFIASPKVAITVTSNNNLEVGKFWSDGKSWCDAIFDVHMLTAVKIEILTPDPGDYALLDKVVLGVQSKLVFTNGRTINPCKTSPPANTTMIDENDMAPDMAQKSVSSRQSYQPPPLPDMAVKPKPNAHFSSDEPDMREAPRNRQSPGLDTRTITDNNDDAVDTDLSEVKCGCSCSCSRQKTKKHTNATMQAG